MIEAGIDHTKHVNERDSGAITISHRPTEIPGLGSVQLEYTSPDNSPVFNKLKTVLVNGVQCVFADSNIRKPKSVIGTNGETYILTLAEDRLSYAKKT